MKRTISTILAVIMMVMCLSVSALAANNNTPVQIWNGGEQRAEGFIQDGEVYIATYNDVAVIFPDETHDWTHIQLTGPTKLQTWADTFGYTYTVEANNCFLVKQGSGEQPNRTATNRVYVNGVLVSNVTVYLSDIDATIYADKEALTKIFPEHKNDFTFEEISAYTLNYWAEVYKYTLTVSEGNRVDLVSDTPQVTKTYVAVYVNGNVVVNAYAYYTNESSSIFYSDSDSLCKIFPDLKGKYTVQEISAKTVNYWAEVYGFTCTLSGSNRLNLVSKDLEERTYVYIYKNGNLVSNTEAYLIKGKGNNVFADSATIIRVFPELDGKYTTQELNANTLNYWADKLGYSLSVSGTRVDVTKQQNETPVTIYVDGSLVSNVNAYVIGSSTDVRTDKASLERIFPAYAGQFQFSDEKSYTVNFWAQKLGYEIKVNGTRVDLTSSTFGERTYVVIYKDGTKVSGLVNTYTLNGGQTIYTDKVDLEHIFPQYTGQFVFNDNRSYTVNYWCERLGFNIQFVGSTVYLTAAVTPTPAPTPAPTVQYDLILEGCTSGIHPTTKQVGNTTEYHVSSSEATQILKQYGITMTSNQPTEIRALATRCNRAVTFYENRIYFHVKGELPIEVTIDGKPVDFDDIGPSIKDGRTRLPVRKVSETLGAKVDWDGATKMVTISKNGTIIQMFIGVNHFYVNGVQKELDVPPEIVMDRTVLPIRAIAEALGYIVDWNSNNGVSHVILKSSS